MIELGARATRALRSGLDPRAFQAATLIELLWPAAGISLDRSISLLQAASRLDDDPAVLADLSAAHLVRAERRQTPRDLLEAVEAADRALELDPRNMAALYNLALALDRLGLDHEARAQWSAYFAVDSTSAWSGEARRRSEARTSANIAFPAIPAAPTRAQLIEYVNRWPALARTVGWDSVLGEWGAAELRGDTLSARTALTLARALGDALEARGGDATLADAARAIAATAHDSPARRELARAHRAYSGARSEYSRSRYRAAERLFRTAAAGATRSPTLRQWATLFRGTALVYLGQPRSGQALIRRVASSADTVRMPALAGRASWSLGTTILRAGGYEGAMRALRRAATLFGRIGEDESLGAVEAIEAEGHFDIGDVDRGFASLQRSLATLRGHRRSVWLHNALWVGAHEAASAGLLRAAARLGAEDAVVAAASGLTAQVVEARLTRARALTRAGKAAAAAGELRAVRSELDRVPPDVRGWLAADLRVSEAMASLRTDPAAAAATLDSVVAHFGGSRRHPVLLVSAMVARAEALLAVDSPAPAAEVLLRAVAILEERQDSIATVSERALMLDAARRIFDRIVMLRVGSGRYLEGLALLERGRATLSHSRVSRRMRTARESAVSSLPPRAPRGEVAIDYALIGDTLLAWTANDSTVHLTRTTVTRARVIETVERLRAAMDHRTDDALVLPLLAQLYEWLMRPLEQEIRRGSGGLILVLDAELADVPFAALFDTVTRTFLVERYSLRVVPNLESASRRHMFDASGARRQRALLVADPAFDPAAFPALRPLTGAASEVRAVAGLYRHVTILAGADATRRTVTAAMPAAAIVHYAGHAVFDDERPERSVLALARVSDAAPSGLSAEEVSRLDLRRVQLVVLSACETLRGRRGRSGGFAGLTGAFLSAGVGGVVGSLWRVDDASTRDLMVEFHRALGTSGDPANALREAQLRLLHSPDSPRRTPAAWAGFRYVGT